MDQSVKDQLEKWVGGESVHNTERDECCPDFSCCKPEMLAPQHEREAFAKAAAEGDNGSKTVDGLLMGFLGRLLSGTTAHIAGSTLDTMH